MTQPSEPITVNTLMTAIQERVGRLGVDIDDLPVAQVYSWWHPMYGKYQDFRHGERHPWDDGLLVVGLFRDDDEVRVYTVRDKPTTGADKQDVSPFKRFILSKRNQSYEVELLTHEGFVESIADEWMVVAEGMTTADAERDRIVKFLKKKGFNASAELVEALEHLEDEEDEPEPQGSTPPSPLS